MGETQAVVDTGSGPRGPARWSELFERHAAEALRLSYLLTGDRDLAQDITQDAFVRLFRRFQDLRRPEAFGAYLRRTVINLAHDHWRKVRVQHQILACETKKGVEADRPVSLLEARDEIWRALQSLPHIQRATVVLRFYEDLTEREIADVMACSTAAVKSRLSRAIKALRSQIPEDQT
jgi:RNA polymerase sigma-70 factor (sigma-E family)